MKPQPPGRGGPDRWLIPYADFMTLLFAFFTTLYAISTVDEQKLTPVASSLQAAFASTPDAVVQGKPGIVPPAVIVPPAAPPVQAAPPPPTLEMVRERLTRAFEDVIGDGRMEIIRDGRGLVLSLPDDAIFETGRADVTIRARDVIGRIGATLFPLTNEIRIEGHTDDVPIRTTRYESNWELSTARASAVVAFMIEQAGIAPDRLSAAGYGEFHPRVANDGTAGRARNRRVDVVVIGPSEPGRTE